MIGRERSRRVALAGTALMLAALLFRAPVAASVVTRGDELMRSGNVDRAIVMYRRAVALDSRLAVAADRLAFALVRRGAPGDAAAALRVADALLRERPGDAALLVDRGFAAERLALWRDAEISFARASTIARDPRYAHLSARMAERHHDRAAMRGHLLDALALDASYAPARAALRSLHR